jgi:hypothetical protein
MILDTTQVLAKNWTFYSTDDMHVLTLNDDTDAAKGL